MSVRAFPERINKREDPHTHTECGQQPPQIGGPGAIKGESLLAQAFFLLPDTMM
jgi:hypothetical protein